MAEIAGFPYFEFAVDKAGKPVDAAARQAIAAHFSAHEVTDLFVISHGWNNDMGEARELYRRFFTGVGKLIDAKKVAGADRRFAVLGILWPSKKFAEEALIPGGAASLGGHALSALQAQIDGLQGVFDNPHAADILRQAKALLPELETRPQARERFADLVRSLPGSPAKARAGDADDAAGRFFALAGAQVMERLAAPVMSAAPRGGAGGAAGLGSPAGGAAGFNPFGGITAAAQNLLNLTTYYQMKARAGLVGSRAVADLVRDIQARSPRTRLHLIGHSFGARLVASLALGAEGAKALKFATMTLIQAAFSHNGFADKFQPEGFFRQVVADQRVAGPILVTHTANDKAVGLAYPLASLVAGQNAASLGGPSDPFGGLGRNGAQNTSEAVNGTLAAVGAASAFEAGKIYNLNADKVITGHSDFCKPEVYYALLSAVATT